MIDVLSDFVSGRTNLDEFESEILPLAWQSDCELIDLVLIEVSYVNDGVSDEETCRERIQQLQNVYELATF